MKLTKVGDKTLKAFAKTERYVCSVGGTRSGKTFSILQMLLIYAITYREPEPLYISVVSETFPHLRRGAIRDFLTILQQENLFVADWFNKSESTYTIGRVVIEFFSADNAGKVHGASRDFLFINEAQNISYDIARQLFVRTRKKIILDYNPTFAFWAIEKIEPRALVIHSTYKDNDYLTPEQIAEIESNKSDTNWWRVYGEGKVGEVEGLIYKDFELIDAMPAELPRVVGLDFGFAHDPTAGVEVAADTKRKYIYLNELCYSLGMLNADIAKVLPRDVSIYADCAEPKSIAELTKSGLRIIPSNKTSKTKVWQIQWLQGWKIFVTKSSLNIIYELRNYAWQKVGEQFINEPIDKYDHAMDAFRYAMFTHFGGARGVYCIH